jgi:hypothetical protein
VKASQGSCSTPSFGNPVDSSLHTLSATTLEDLDHSLDQDTLVCGDSAAHKQLVTEVLERIDGLRVFDAGRLEMSRLVEGLTPLLIGINIRHKTHGSSSRWSALSWAMGPARRLPGCTTVDLPDSRAALRRVDWDAARAG